MKITHSDCNNALKFQWSCIPCISSSSNGSSTGGTNNSNGSSDNKHGAEVFPRSRFHHAACSQGRYVYILGGKDRYSPLRDLWRFDTASQVWEQIDVTDAIPHLQGHTMLAHKSQLLIFGGTFYDTSEDTPLWIYNTDLNHVRKYSREPGASYPVGRREHSAVIYKNSMYIYGGFSDNSGSTDEFWAFNIAEEEWRLIRRHKPGKRHGHVAVVVGNHMWLHGGMKELTALSDLWMFNFPMSTWNKVKGVGASPTLSNHTAHVVENTLILLGGARSGKASQEVWTFKFDTLTWRHISTQYGDVYPPVTLHSSILLSASGVQASRDDRTRSVPQLKGKSVHSDQSVRPWTSPAVNAAEINEPAVDIRPSNTVNILRLDTLRSCLDSNNNKSEEDIYFDSALGHHEQETSFSVTNCDGTVHQQSSKISSFNATHKDRNQAGYFEKPSLDQSESVLKQQAGNTSKIRPASAEHCQDDLPLLGRFHSITSDVDLGENNLTVTLSDEDFLGLRKLDEHDSKGFSNHAFEQTFQKKVGDDKFPFRKYLADGQGASVGCNHFENPLYKEFRSGDNYVRRSNPDMSTKSQSEFACWPGDENIPPRSKCVDDLIVEDIEFSDIGQMLHNTHISYPSTSSLKWSSLKDLNTYTADHDKGSELDYSLLLESQRQLAKSCSSIVSCHTSNFYDNQKKLFHKSIPDRGKEGDFLKKEPLCNVTKRENCQVTTGKYIKNVGATGARPHSHLLRSRGSSHRLVAQGKQAVATQTTGSLLSLKSGKSDSEFRTNHQNFSHFIMDTSVGSEHQAVASSSEQSKPRAAECSVLGDTQLCILVLGGQTDMHSFQKEPLKMWRCQLY